MPAAGTAGSSQDSEEHALCPSFSLPSWREAPSPRSPAPMSLGPGVPNPRGSTPAPRSRCSLQPWVGTGLQDGLGSWVKAAASFLTHTQPFSCLPPPLGTSRAHEAAQGATAASAEDGFATPSPWCSLLPQPPCQHPVGQAATDGGIDFWERERLHGARQGRSKGTALCSASSVVTDVALARAQAPPAAAGIWLSTGFPCQDG